MNPSDLHLASGETFDASAGGAGSLPRSWARRWRADPDREQLHDPTRGWLSRGALDDGSRAVAGRLAGVGLEAGDRVLVSAGASADLVIAHLACLRLGLVVVPTNTAYRAPELAHVVGDARPRLAILDDDERAGWIRAADSSVSVLGPAVDLPDGEPPPLDAAAPEAPALIGYTSGTTGRPKGAVLSHANLLASAEALRLAWRWQEADRLVLALPLFHMHGLGVGLHGTLHCGASAVLVPAFDPDAVLDAAARHAATLFFGVPTMYQRLADHARAKQLGKLRLCVSGSAPLPAALHERFERATGHRVLERYGMTETAMLVSNPHDAERRPGTVGLPLPGVELRLEGEPAEIHVRGPNVFAGYWERPDANREAFTSDGWFRTGDLGRLDPDGYLRIEGRTKELVISGGYNVYPREVEDVLRAHPDVEDVAVVGEADAKWGERVVAYVVSAHPIDVSELRSFAASRLAAYKHPRAVHRVDALPRNALGKVQKHRLERGRVLPDG